MTADESTPKLHIDTDWKAQAQAEKERLTEKEAEQQKNQPDGDGARGELPPADFRALVGLLASQAMMGLGMFGDKESGQVMIDLDGARFNVDLLSVIEEKTKGNLSDEETKELGQVLNELRNRYVQITQLLAQQMAEQGNNPAAPDAAVPDLRMPESS